LCSVWLAAGGSILAARHALVDGVAIALAEASTTFSDHGEGFCMIHDVAVAIRRMQYDGKVRRVMTVDCDATRATALPPSSLECEFPTKPPALVVRGRFGEIQRRH